MEPVHPEEISGRCDDERRGQKHAQGRKHDGWRRRHAKTLDAGADPAVEEDDGERDAADEIGGLGILELNAADAVLAGGQSDAQENEQQRRPDPKRDQAGEGRDDEESRANEDCKGDRFNHSPVLHAG